MDISVIIPTFNRQASICQSVRTYLQALTEQANPLNIAVELIVIDDGSSDRTFGVLQETVQGIPNLHLVRLKENVGPGLARQAGLKYATGQWLWFLDDDDALDATGLKNMLSKWLAVDDDVDVLAHSLKNSYVGDAQSTRLRVGRNVLAFWERQEVFNYLFRRRLLDLEGISFSAGVHEDIRYVFDLIRLSKGIEVVPVQVVRKHRTPGAITATMTNARIDGLVQAYNELSALLLVSDCFSGQGLLDQTLGVILYLISKEPEASAASLLAHLKTKEEHQDAWSSDMRDAGCYGVNATNFKYASSVWRRPHEDFGILAVILRNIFETRLSCKDLDTSLFLAPDEIRACCKRFFVDGVRKGDVVLLKAKADIGLQEIRRAKDDLILRINTDQAPECSGCPYIERRHAECSGIDYISLENFSYCNMRCTYCSPKYYGGTEALYNAVDIITQLADEKDGLDSACHVVWGGGEPTLSPRFKPVNAVLMQLPQVKKMRILSNSLKYSDNLDALLADERAHLVTSLDAGTQFRFQEIRGNGKLDDVLEILQRYRMSMKDKRRATLKYILRSDNSCSEEIEAFVGRMQTGGFLDSMFQISCDFTLEKADDALVCAMYELSVSLFVAGAQTVFFDDLIRDRVRIDHALSLRVRAYLDQNNLDQRYVLTPQSPDKIVLWGAGKQSDWYLNRTSSGQSGRIIGVVSDGEQLKALDSAVDGRIFPSGVQSMYEIVRNIEACGLGERIDRRVIL